MDNEYENNKNKNEMSEEERAERWRKIQEHLDYLERRLSGRHWFNTAEYLDPRGDFLDSIFGPDNRPEQLSITLVERKDLDETLTVVTPVDLMCKITVFAKPEDFWKLHSGGVKGLIYLFTPANWETCFPEDGLRSFKDVNLQLLPGTKVEADGKQVTIPNEEASYEELLLTVKLKYLEPAARRIITFLSRFKAGFADYLRPGADEIFEELYETIKSWDLEKDGVNAFRNNPDTYLSKLRTEIAEEKKKARQSSNQALPGDIL